VARTLEQSPATAGPTASQSLAALGLPRCVTHAETGRRRRAGTSSNRAPSTAQTALRAGELGAGLLMLVLHAPSLNDMEVSVWAIVLPS
jgi:hypothetical protein